MRRSMKTLALVLTLLLAMSLYAPMALAATNFYPGVIDGSSDSAYISSVTPSLPSGSLLAGKQRIDIVYNSYMQWYYSDLPTSATLSFNIHGYTDRSSTGALSGVIVDPSSLAAGVTASISGSRLSVTYNPRQQGSVPFSLRLVGPEHAAAPNDAYIGSETTLTFYPEAVGSARPYYYTQYYNNSYALALEKPATLYAGSTYTLTAILTANGAAYDSGYNYYPNNPSSYYGGEYYIYYNSVNVTSGYYPYSTVLAQVYAGGAWVNPISGTTAFTLSELSAMNLSPRVRWSSAIGYSAYPYTSVQNPDIKVSFSSDAPSSVVTVIQATDQSAVFQAMQPGTYNLTLSIPAGYVLSNGDSLSNSGTGGMYIIPPGDVYGSYYLDPNYMTRYYPYSTSSVSTMKTFQLTVLPNPNAAVTPLIPLAPPVTTPVVGGTFPIGSKIGLVLKDGMEVKNAAGSVIRTLPKSSVIILNTLVNQYEIAFAGGTGFVPKALINRTSAAVPQNGVIRTLSSSCTMHKSSSTASVRLTSLSSGTSVIVFSTNNSWSYIYADGKFGFIRSTFASR